MTKPKIQKMDPVQEARAMLSSSMALELELDELGRMEDIELTQKARLRNYVELARVYRPPMRTFEDNQGRSFKRRSNIRMSEWRDYQQTPDFYDVEYEKFFVALFTGRLSPEALELEHEDRIALGQLIVDDMLTDEYLPLKQCLFEDILMPTASKQNASVGQNDGTRNGETAPTITENP